MRCITDPVFGKLTLDVIWGGKFEFDGIGKIELEIDVDSVSGADAEPPTEAQRHAFSMFLQWFSASDWERALQRLAEYAARKGRAGFALSPADVPAVTPPWREVFGRPVVFLPSEQDFFDLSFQWHCDYTGDHGAEIVFREGTPLGFCFAGDGEPEEAF